MKKTIKTLLSTILTLALVLSLAACSEEPVTSSNQDLEDDFFADTQNVISVETDSTEEDTSEESSSNDTVQESQTGGKGWKQVLSSMPKKLRGTTIKVVNWNPVTEYTGAATAIKDFEKQTGIKVEWQVIDHAVYFTRLAALIASKKDIPDVVRTRTPLATNMTSFQPISAANYDFTDEVWDKALMKDYTFNGEIYATSLKNTHFGSVSMMFYNRELIKKYDYEDPYTLWKNGKWTFNKFLEMCRTYKKEAKAKTACTGATWEEWTQLYGIRGPVGFDGSKYYNMLNDSKFLTVNQQIADLYNSEELIVNGCAELMDANESLFYAGESVHLRRNNPYLSTLKTNGTLYAVPMPAIDGQSKYYQGRDEYEAYAIPQGAKNPEAVPYFLRFFLDGNNYNLDTLFCNKQNLEVYNWCMSQENTIWSTNYLDNSDNFASTDGGIINVQGNQVKSYIDSNSSVIEARVKRYNKALKQIK